MKVFKEKKDVSGNFLALDLEIENNRLTLITVYGQNQDTPSFYDKIKDTINEFNNNNYIICGDFILVLNPSLDYDNSYKTVKGKRKTPRNY